MIRPIEELCEVCACLRCNNPSDAKKEHLLKNHKTSMIEDIMRMWPYEYPRCPVEPCGELLFTDIDKVRHLRGHGRGLVTAWMESQIDYRVFKKELDNTKYPRRSSLDEFFWR